MTESGRVLALDIGSGGVTAALVDTRLNTHHLIEIGWTLERGEDLTATLSPEGVRTSAESVVREAARQAPHPDAVVLSSMMHTLLIADPEGVPTTPVFTWLDMAEFPGAASAVGRLGADYTRRSGTWFHPSFPAYKLARLRSRSRDFPPAGSRLHSVRSWIQQRWTGSLCEDTSTASASGLLNLGSGDWDPATLDAIGIDRAILLPLDSPDQVYPLAPQVARRLGLPAGLPVVAGGGDGFLAALGSSCHTEERLAITLGTTAGVRRFQSAPEDVTDRGLFCYRYDRDAFLLGAASNNGGNVLEWSRREFGDGDGEPADTPVFLPWVFGERAPFWDTHRKPRWIGVRHAHTPSDLSRSVVEAVAFTMAHYCRLTDEGARTRMGILSGNGFRSDDVARLLGGLLPFPLVIPEDPGTATLRGAARIGFQAMGIDTAGAADDLLERAAGVDPCEDPLVVERFEAFLAQFSKSEARQSSNNDA